MNETTISIMGYALVVRYVVYDGGYTEWHIKSAPNDSLFNVLLRIHYSDYIAAEVRKAWFEEEYERNIINSSQMSMFSEDMPEPF